LSIGLLSTLWPNTQDHS
jgi:cytochrome P450